MSKPLLERDDGLRDRRKCESFHPIARHHERFDAHGRNVPTLPLNLASGFDFTSERRHGEQREVGIVSRTAFATVSRCSELAIAARHSTRFSTHRTTIAEPRRVL